MSNFDKIELALAVFALIVYLVHCIGKAILKRDMERSEAKWKAETTARRWESALLYSTFRSSQCWSAMLDLVEGNPEHFTEPQRVILRDWARLKKAELER